MSATNTNNILEFLKVMNQNYGTGFTLADVCKVRKGVPLIEVTKKQLVIGGISLIQYTIKVCPTNGSGKVKKYGTDDLTYGNFPFIQRFVPRGFSILVDASSGAIVCHMNGLPKFGGATVGDDDELTGAKMGQSVSDGELASKKTKVIVSKKANGKFAVFTFFQLVDGKWYLMGGSKNQHFVVCIQTEEEYVRNMVEIRKGLGNLGTNCLALDIISCFVGSFTTFDALHATASTFVNVNLVGEYRDGAHMVSLRGQAKDIAFFALTEKHAILPKDYVAGDAIANLQFLRDAGLTTVPFEEMSYEEFVSKATDLRLGTRSEGSVIYYLNEDNKTIAIHKYKTWWYIVIRMVREFLKREFKMGRVSGWETLLLATMAKRNNAFMNMPSTLFNNWYNLLHKFCTWFGDKMDNGELGIGSIGFMAGKNDDGFPMLGMGCVWDMFLTETKANDDFDESFLNDDEDQLTAGVSGLAIFFSAIPGFGKSTLAKMIIPLLIEAGISVVEINQDELKADHGKNAKSVCLQMMEDAMKQTGEGRPTIVIVTRNNSDRSQRSKYMDAARKNNWATSFIVPNQLTTLLGLAICCRATIDRVGHENFPEGFKERINVVLSFAASFESPTPADADSIIPLDFIKGGSFDDSNERIAELLKTLSWLNECFVTKKAAPRPFDCDVTSEVPDLSNPDTLEEKLPASLVDLRIPAEVMCDALFDWIMESYSGFEIIDPIKASQTLPPYVGAFLTDKERRVLIGQTDKVVGISNSQGNPDPFILVKADSAAPVPSASSATVAKEPTLSDIPTHDENGNELSKKARNKLLKKAKKAFAKSATKSQTKDCPNRKIAEHCTMKFGLGPADISWLAPLLGLDAQVVIESIRFYDISQHPEYRGKKEGIVAVCPCSIIGPDGESLNHLVTSGVPHITYSVPKNVRPVAAMKLLQLDNNGGIVPENEIMYESPIVLHSTIRGPGI